MTATTYTHVVFPAGRKPTLAELQTLEGLRGLFSDGLDCGYDIDTRRPTLRFERQVFLQMRQNNFAFEGLIAAWEKRGCLVLGKLHFMADATMLQTLSENAAAIESDLLTLHTDAYDNDRNTPIVQRGPRGESVEQKQAKAIESQALSRLEIVRQVCQARAIGDYARWVPGLLALVVFILILTAGGLLYNKLANSKLESRKETIERVAKDPLKKTGGRADAQGKREEQARKSDNK